MCGRVAARSAGSTSAAHGIAAQVMAVRIQRPAAGARRERDRGALRVIDDEVVPLQLDCPRCLFDRDHGWSSCLWTGESANSARSEPAFSGTPRRPRGRVFCDAVPSARVERRNADSVHVLVACTVPIAWLD